MAPGVSDFVIDDFEPAYLETGRRGEFPARVDAALAELEDCRACPRDCGVDRTTNGRALCHVGRYARVASAFPHHGEEACLRGRHGSGTIFFSYCNLRCVFCQNWDISQAPAGRECTASELAALMLELQDQGCHNINLVTPEHVVPQIIEALAIAIPEGLRLPLVYNTSAYDSPWSLQMMDGIVDIYMPDFKFWEPDTARRLAKAKDYPLVARQAIAEMHRQVGVLRTDRHGVAQRGLLVRHLVMPGQVRDATAIFDWLAAEISPDTFVNVMGQYRPEHRVPANGRYADINRRPLRAELDAAFDAARHAGLWRFDM
jgi:putative pyruvate formate lyase activating enzyme